MKLTHLAHIVETFIVIFLCFHIFVLTPTQSPSPHHLDTSLAIGRSDG